MSEKNIESQLLDKEVDISSDLPLRKWLYSWLLDPHIEGDQELLNAVADDSDMVAGEAEFFKVGAEVGKVSNNDESLIKPLS